MKKNYYQWSDLDRDIAKLATSVARSRWYPDYIVGISRGGCIPAVYLSHALGVPMKPLEVSLRDSEDAGCVSDCGMAEDAFGYVYPGQDDGHNQAKNILVVDDINDSGATFNWILSDWPNSCFPDHNRWAEVWGQNVRFAVLHNNESSNFKQVEYAANYINKADNDIWIVYPWESLSPDK